jgi:NADPH:quinone reductase-like Zn-dependent oxidoreductase
MKAVRIHQYGDVDQLIYEDVPDPQPQAGQVLIQIAATSVNPIDWKILSGAMQAIFPLKLPVILGRDASGTVKQLGQGVTQFKVGDRVLAVANGTYAELVAVEVPAVAVAPEKLDLIEGGALPLVTTTGVQLVEIGVGVKKGQKILVTGALGGVGRSAVYAAKRAGATVVAGVRANQLTDAAEVGADAVIALEDESQVAKHAPFDAIADTVGPEVTAKLLPHVKPGGKVVTVTAPPNAAQFPQVSVSHFQMHVDGKRLGEIAQDVVAKRLRIPIALRLPLSQAREGVAAARKGSIGKVILMP